MRPAVSAVEGREKNHLLTKPKHKGNNSAVTKERGRLGVRDSSRIYFEEDGEDG